MLLEGHQVFGVARRGKMLESLQDEASSFSGEFISVVADLSERNGQEMAIATISEGDSPVSVVVNNAGGSVVINEIDPEPDWMASLELQFHAARRIADAFVSDMIDLGFGRIINIGAPLEPPTRMNGSTVAKGALTVWSKMRSSELGRSGITVNTVAPGRVISEQVLERLHPTEADRRRFAEENIPLGYLGHPEDVAGVVSFLISEDARYITGELVHVDGGLRRGAW
jgi:3-oxoacyl-[acyl-carrier protein] reductase